MDATQIPHELNSEPQRYKGSLAGTFLRTLLIFTFIPLSLIGVAYFRTRTVLQDQAVIQAQNLLTTQLNVIDREVANREARLEKLAARSDFSILIELALHANPKSQEFREIRNSVLREFDNLNRQEDTPAFDQILLLDTRGNIKIAGNSKWQDLKIDPTIINPSLENSHSIALYGLSPIYKNELILITEFQYITERGSKLGSIVGINEKNNLRGIVQPLNGLSSLASTYFILSDQQLIYSEPETGNFILVQSASQSEINSSLSTLRIEKSPKPISLSIKTPNGENALAQIQWFPRIQTGVVLNVNPNDIYDQIKNLIPFTALLILGSLLATGLILLYVNNRVIRPITSLSDIARGFADGNWGRRAEIIGNDEIGVLAKSFNHMADELGRTYRSLEEKVDERGRQMRATAEIAQNITTLSNLDELLDKTVELLVEQFGFYQSSVFLLDRAGKYVEFKTGFGSGSDKFSKKKHKYEVNSKSIMGWVSANNQPRFASNVLEDPLHKVNELLPDTRSEASLPISIGNLVLGVLNVQRTETGDFSPETIVMLQTITSQIATAIQSSGLTEANQVNFEELERLYRSSRLIAEAKTEQEILEISSLILKEAPYPIMLLSIRNAKWEIYSSSDSMQKDILHGSLLTNITAANMKEIEHYLLNGFVIAPQTSADLPNVFLDIMQKLDMYNAAFVPIRKNKELTAIFILGGQKQIVSNAIVQPYNNLADLISITMEKTEAIRLTEKHLHEAEALASINETVATSSDLQSFFKTLFNRIQEIVGNYSLIIALYNDQNESISNPFRYDDEKSLTTDSYPIGEGLISILIKTRQPLLIVKDIEGKMVELGIKTSDKPARSWMGTPMLVQNKPIGVLILQDTENENAFNEADFRLFNAIAGQVAGLINNAQLLDESRNRSIQLETAAEIARDISGSLNLDELLIKAVNFIHERFNFYHASVFLHDLPGEFAVIREATGEAGAQMKRAGFKIGIGSNSIVGYVSSQGQQIVVNDNTKDATYPGNPLIPDTRAEAAFPLRVGGRILGVLDVQSIYPFAFTEDKLRGLQILTDQIAIAVVNTELFAETQEHLSQHRLLHHITTTAASGSTLEEALDNAVSGLQVTLGGDRVSILLANQEKNMLEVKASMGYAEDITIVKIPFGSGITGWAASHKQAIRVKDITEDPRYIQVSLNTRSELAVPLVYRSELLGVLNVESEQIDAYTENDEEMLGTLGGSLAAIIANARLLEQIRVQSERDRLIYEVTSKIRKAADIQSILTITATELTRLTGADYTKIKINSHNTP